MGSHTYVELLLYCYRRYYLCALRPSKQPYYFVICVYDIFYFSALDYTLIYAQCVNKSKLPTRKKYGENLPGIRKHMRTNRTELN